MSVYMVFTREKTLDSAELSRYSQEVSATISGHPLKVLAAYGPHEDLEGSPTEGTVILEFPDTEAAKRWYDGPEYRRVREHRFKGARYHAILIEGV
jgi:uncharacterized protein (DUF1330 family)